MADEIKNYVAPIGALVFTEPDFTKDLSGVIQDLTQLKGELQVALTLINNLNIANLTAPILATVEQPVPTIRVYDPILSGSMIHPPFELNVAELPKIYNNYRVPSMSQQETYVGGLLPDFPDYDFPDFQEPERVDYVEEAPTDYVPTENPVNVYNPNYDSVPAETTSGSTYPTNVVTVAPSTVPTPVPVYDTNGVPVGYVYPYTTPEYEQEPTTTSGDIQVSYVDGFYIDEQGIENAIDKAEAEIKDPFVIVDAEMFTDYYGVTVADSLASSLGYPSLAEIELLGHKIVYYPPDTLFNTPVDQLQFQVMNDEGIAEAVAVTTLGLTAVAVSIIGLTLATRSPQLAYATTTSFGAGAIVMFPMDQVVGTSYDYNKYVVSPANTFMLLDLKFNVDPLNPESVNAFVARWADIVEFDKYMNVVYKGTDIVIIRMAYRYYILSNSPITDIPSEQFSKTVPNFAYLI